MLNKTPAYILISMAFFILIGMGFAYSYFFYPNQHPIDCVVKKVTGKDCPTCGFSRSFSFYSHAKFQEGKQYNPLSYKVFVFFALQWCFRFVVILIYFTVHKVFSKIWMGSDAIISILLFLLAFLPVILKF